MKNLSGRCLCGAVTFTVEEATTTHNVCHCGMCRRWSGGPAMNITSKGVVFSGEENLKRYDSSDWAQRGFCGVCGSNLFYLFKPVQQYFMTRGAFDDESPFELRGEIYVDFQPPGYAFAGDLERLTEAEFMEKFGG